MTEIHGIRYQCGNFRFTIDGRTPVEWRLDEIAEQLDLIIKLLKKEGEK